MIDIVEQMKLERIGIFACGFNTVNHAAANAMDEVAVEKSDRLIQAAHQVGLEFLPFFGLHVADCHTPTAAIKGVQVIGTNLLAVPDNRRVKMIGSAARAKFPAEHAVSVLRLIL